MQRLLKVNKASSRHLLNLTTSFSCRRNSIITSSFGKKTNNSVLFDKKPFSMSNRYIQQLCRQMVVSWQSSESFQLFKLTLDQMNSFNPVDKSSQSNKNQASYDGKQSDQDNEDDKRRVKPVGLLFAILIGIYMVASYNYFKRIEELEHKLKLEKEKTNQASQAAAATSLNQSQAQQADSRAHMNDFPFDFDVKEAPKSNTPASSNDLNRYAASNTPFVTISGTNLIQWSEVRILLAKKAIKEVICLRNNNLAAFRPNETFDSGLDTRKHQFYYLQTSPTDLENRLAKIQDELNVPTDQRVPIVYKDSEFINNLVGLIILGGMLALTLRLGRFLMSRVQNVQSDMFSQFTKARFTTVDPHLKSGVPPVQFKDVAGLHEAKIEVKEFVDYLREPERLAKLGAKVPKGALLLGPPGCGKTLLAKAVANEANVPFFNIAGTEFIEVIGGVGAARVRDLFEQAKKQAPAIIYIDEIDAVGKKRSESHGHGEMDQTLNQLLVSMDGLESNSNVVVLASTNRADVLDKALLRPGRLDRKITIDLPTYDERIEILNVHMRGLKIEWNKEERENFVSQLSHLTPGFSGADLANVCNESALLAVRDNEKSVDKKHFYAALERVVGGAEKKSSTSSIEDRKLIAYNECGKVIVSWFHPNADLILKVSLLARTKSNSFAQYLKSDKKLHSSDDLFDQMCLNFGGRVAESLVFDSHSNISENDLKRITAIAYAKIESFGMNEKVGHISFPTRNEERATGQIGIKPYSKKLRSIIDLEVGKLVAEAQKAAERTLTTNMDKLHLLSTELLKRESLTFQDIVELIGEPVNIARFKNINYTNFSTSSSAKAQATETTEKKE